MSRVVDLCDPEQVRLLGTSIQELTGNWRGYADRAGPGQPDVAPTQRFGNTLFRLGRAEAFLTYSARHPTTRNLVVFPARLRAGSAITLFNPATRAPLQRLGPGGALETF